MSPEVVLDHLLRVVNEEYLRVSESLLLLNDPSDEDGSFFMGQQHALVYLRASLLRTKDARTEPLPPLQAVELNWALWLRAYGGQYGPYARGMTEVVTRYLRYLSDLARRG